MPGGLKQRRENYIKQARAIYENDDVEIDEHPSLSESDGGCWVAAWVWVSDEEAA